MKLLPALAYKLETTYLLRQPEGPEGAEQLSAAAAAPEVDPAEVAREGMRGVNYELNQISTLSPQAGEIVGQQLPDMIAQGINSPDDAERLGAAAAVAQAEIETYLAEGNEDAANLPKEVNTEVQAWFTEVQTQMVAAQAALAEQVEAHPDNEILKDQSDAFAGMVDEVNALAEEAGEDLGILEQRALEGGATGHLGERLAQIAEGEVGQVTNDAAGNEKYTPGDVDQPWCADFVNWCLEQSGGQGTGSSMAQSFVEGSGFGHVAIVTDEGGGTVGGNEGSAVSDGGNASSFEHAISAEDVSAGNFEARKTAAEAQVGDIVVRSRDAGPDASAADQNVA